MQKEDETKVSVMVSLSELDLKNLMEVQKYYETERGLKLKRASTIKMLLADTATKVREEKKI